MKASKQLGFHSTRGLFDELNSHQPVDLEISTAREKEEQREKKVEMVVERPSSRKMHQTHSGAFLMNKLPQWERIGYLGRRNLFESMAHSKVQPAFKLKRRAGSMSKTIG